MASCLALSLSRNRAIWSAISMPRRSRAHNPAQAHRALI
jgi:hypothetical protein